MWVKTLDTRVEVYGYSLPLSKSYSGTHWQLSVVRVLTVNVICCSERASPTKCTKMNMSRSGERFMVLQTTMGSHTVSHIFILTHERAKQNCCFSVANALRIDFVPTIELVKVGRRKRTCWE